MSPRMRVAQPFRLFALTLIPLLVTFAGCGVELSADQRTTEIFKNLTVTNSEGGTELRAAEQLQIRVEYTQPYAAALDVECDLLDAGGNVKVSDIFVAVIPGNAPENIPTSVRKNYKDEVTPTVASIDQAFFAPGNPGSYVVNCFTQEDDNNEVERTITISPGPTATPEQTVP